MTTETAESLDLDRVIDAKLAVVSVTDHHKQS